MAIILAIGRAIINPDSSGFFPESQLANAITKAAIKLLKQNHNYLFILINK